MDSSRWGLVVYENPGQVTADAKGTSCDVEGSVIES